MVFSLVFGSVVAASDAGGIESRPLEARSGPRGATMFVELPAEDTGVKTENNYTDPRMWWEKYQEFSIGAVGTGVAVADYDNDGRPDLFVASKTETDRLFRNLGDWKFEDVTEKAGLSGLPGGWAGRWARAKAMIGLDENADSSTSAWTQGATFADVNNDGFLDLFVTRFGEPNQLFINNRDGTFTERAAEAGLAIVDGSGTAAFADYDRDGWLDLYLQTNLFDYSKHPDGRRDYLFRNDADGTFSNVTDRAGIGGETQGHSVVWWDFDDDGWPDIYVANDFAAPDNLYRNNRDGTFSDVISSVVPHMPYSSMGSDLGDVNNDGRIDFFVADMAATTPEKDQRGMADSRARSVDPSEGSKDRPQFMRNALFVNSGVPVFQEAAFLAGLDATDWTWATRFEDLDNDGRLDLFVTNGMVRELHNADLITAVMSGESGTARVRAMRESPVFAEKNLAFRNMGDLRFEQVGHDWGLDHEGVSFGAAFGDFDGDGDLDLACANYQAGVLLLRNDSEFGHAATFSLRGTVSNRFGVGATVRIETASGTQVRSLVLARGYLSSSEPIVHFGLGGDMIVGRLTVSWPSGHEQVFTDLPADHHHTITEPSMAGPPSYERKSFPVGQFVKLDMPVSSREPLVDEVVQQPLLPIRHSRAGPPLAVADINGDNAADLVVGGTSLDPIRILIGNHVGGFSPPRPLSPVSTSSVNDGPVLLFDFDGDGDSDLFVTRTGVSQPPGDIAYQPVLLLNDGRGVFFEAPSNALPSLSISAGAAAAADFNRDGRLDVFIGGRVIPGDYPMPPRSALLVNDGGAFREITDGVAPGLGDVGMVTSALWTDVDGDGWLDLLLALDWGTIRYWRNNNGRSFEDRSESAGFAAAGVGWWNSLAGADFNGDGRVDYVAGNLGLNTQYRASAEQPALLYYGDFAGEGFPQIVEARHDGDRIVPWRNRGDLANSIRSLRRRFRSNDDFSRATLQEIVGEDKLASARRFAATEFRSGMFLSEPDGAFKFQPLPRVAQIAPIFGIAAGDFDGDGHADIYALHNSHAPIAAVTRFDGGLSQLLCGDGRGNFTAVSPGESGLAVTGDAKALVVLDLDADGWPDFVVSRNNDSALAFRNTGKAGRQSFRVTLNGPIGNSPAIGARITVELTDGTLEVNEVSAGSGYFSQSIAAGYFGFYEGNPPREIRVDWPSGRQSSHPWRGGSGAIVLAEPSR